MMSLEGCETFDGLIETAILNYWVLWIFYKFLQRLTSNVSETYFHPLVMIFSHFLVGFLLVIHSSGLQVANSKYNSAKFASRTRNVSIADTFDPIDTSNKGNLTIGIIIPKTTFNKRAYTKAINDTVKHLNKNVGGKGPKLNFLRHYNFNPTNVKYVPYSLTPSPTGKSKVLVRSRGVIKYSNPLFKESRMKYVI